MNFVEKILQTRNGDPLTGADIEAMIQLFTAGKIPDYQLSAWLMAVFFRGLSREETSALTLAMARSGQMLDLSLAPGIKVDKHSTGGVADTVTLILAPLVAAAGVPVAKMSGRGLGFTGGTIDKLEAIPGFSTALSEADFVAQLHKIGIALTSQSSSIAPADGKIYALRDVTGTIESIPLIASSVMSKKIASGADRILLDVKVGQGAFMKDLAAARELAETMVEIGERLGKKTIALLTDMNQPLGTAIGNGLEVAEAIEILQGGGSRRLRETVLILGSYMLLLAEKAENLQAAQEKLSELLASGAALAKFEEWIMAQGGHNQILLEPHKLYDTPYTFTVLAKEAGFVQTMAAEKLGKIAMRLGAGRAYKGQTIDLAVGIRLLVQVGDLVEPGQKIACLYTQSETAALQVADEVKDAIVIEPIPQKPQPLLLGLVDETGFHPIAL